MILNIITFMLMNIHAISLLLFLQPLTNNIVSGREYIKYEKGEVCRTHLNARKIMQPEQIHLIYIPIRDVLLLSGAGR